MKEWIKTARNADEQANEADAVDGEKVDTPVVETTASESRSSEGEPKKKKKKKHKHSSTDRDSSVAETESDAERRRQRKKEKREKRLARESSKESKEDSPATMSPMKMDVEEEPVPEALKAASVTDLLSETPKGLCW